MIKTLLIDDQNSVQYGNIELIDAWRESDSALLWVDICEETLEDEEQLLHSLECHPLAVRDALRDRHPPKIELFDNYLFILYRGIYQVQQQIQFDHLQIGMFVGRRILITRHEKESLAINSLFNETGASYLRKSAITLALRIFHTSSNRYLQTLFNFEDELDNLEDSFREQASDQLMRTLTIYRSQLVKLRRIFNYHVAIGAEIKLLVEDETDLINPPDLHTAIDLYERLERLSSLSQMYYDICGDLIDGYLSISSHQLNNTMQVLTVITAIFIPLGFLAGLYGMNFEFMPELKIKYGYFYLLGFMALIAAALITLFKKEKMAVNLRLMIILTESTL